VTSSDKPRSSAIQPYNKSLDGCAENGGPEKAGPIMPKVRRQKMEDRKMEDQIWQKMEDQKMQDQLSFICVHYTHKTVTVKNTVIS